MIIRDSNLGFQFSTSTVLFIFFVETNSWFMWMTFLRRIQNRLQLIYYSFVCTVVSSKWLIISRRLAFCVGSPYFLCFMFLRYPIIDKVSGGQIITKELHNNYFRTIVVSGNFNENVNCVNLTKTLVVVKRGKY